MSNSLTSEQFIEKAIKKHGSKYDYSKVKYINNHTQVTIICPIHGEFEQDPHDHLKGCGCFQCSCEKRSLSYKKFIEKASSIHNNKYNYDKVDYVNNRTKVTITCPIHGDFEQVPRAHLRGCGCPKCRSPKGELAIMEYLEKHDIEFIAQYNVKIETEDMTHSVKYDFYIPKYNLLLEFQGGQHYEFVKYFHKTQENYLYKQKLDAIKMDWAIRNGYNFIPIPYWDLERIDEVLDELFKEV